MPSHYDTLGVSKGASKDDVKKAYRKAAMEHHPDKGGNEERFKEITEAYEVLHNDDERQKYDSLGHDNYYRAGNAPPHTDLNDLMSHIFGGGNPFSGGFGPFGFHFSGRNEQQATTYASPIEVSLHELYTGVVKHITINIQKPCKACLVICSHCNGQGTIQQQISLGPMFTQIVNSPCGHCGACGKRNVPGCSSCLSKGAINEMKVIDFDIPPGAKEGFEKRYHGYGKTEKDDLVLKVKEKGDDHFRRVDNDLHYAHKMPFWQSIVGTTISIPHFAGSFEINTTTLGIIDPTRKYTVQNKGMPRDSKMFGNLVISFVIEYPQKILDDAQRAIMLESLRAIAIA